MPGKQLRETQKGDRKERLAGLLLSGIGSAVLVPRPDDFGVDFYCEITKPDGVSFRSTGYCFGVQIKTRSKDNRVSYGGWSRRGKKQWKDYEVEWLFNQPLPFLIGIAASNYSSLDLYLPSGMWHARWMGGRPFRVDLSPDRPNPVDQSGLLPSAENVLNAAGDGQHWTVPLGPPVVSLATAQADDEAYLANIREVLMRTLELERTNIMAHAQGVPYREWLLEWSSNSLPAPHLTHLGTQWFANSGGGMNLDRCGRALSIALPALALNLKAQGATQAMAQLRDAILFVNKIRPIPIGIKKEIIDFLDVPQ